MGAAPVRPGPGQWIDHGLAPGLLVVYACFGDHCSPPNETSLCSAGGGSGCCAPGRAGPLCESCAEGFAKQNDRCIPCDGAAWAGIAPRVLAKAGLLTVLCAKVLDKATTRSYTGTVGFAT